MTNKITIKRSSVPGKVPAAGDLDYGELAINYRDGSLFFKNSDNVVSTVASTQFVSVTGNVTGGNLNISGQVSATGNISGNNFIGNGSLLTGITATAAPAGNTGDVQFNNNGSTGGSSNFKFDGANISVSGNVVSGNVTATGNISGNYVIGNGSALTSIVGANVTGTVANATYAINAGSATTASTVTANAQPNITSVGILSGLTVTANTTSGNFLTGGLISAAGGITGASFTGNGRALTSLNAANIDTGTLPSARLSGTYTITVSGAATTAGTVTTAAQPNITSVGTLTAATITGNTTSGNFLTGGLISAAGNISGNYFIGNGSQLTGIPTKLPVYARSMLIELVLVNGSFTISGRTGSVVINTIA
jgi:hypothetical protein